MRASENETWAHVTCYAVINDRELQWYSTSVVSQTAASVTVCRIRKFVFFFCYVNLSNLTFVMGYFV